MKRKLASIQVINKILPIKKADFIEIAQVLNWYVVVKKGQFKVGQKVVYFEIDSFLDTSKEQFEFLKDRGLHSLQIGDKIIKRHALKTMKLRGVYSQGLILDIKDFKLNDDLKIGTDLTSQLDVMKYEKIVPMTDDIIGQFYSKLSPKTGAVRIQSLTNEQFNELKKLELEPSIKIDGTSVSLMNINDEIRIFGHQWELSKDEYKYDIAKKQGLVDKLKNYQNMSLQMELVGPRINKNKLKLDEKRYFIYSIWKDGFKLKRQDWPEEFKSDGVPLANQYTLKDTIEESVKMIDGIRGNVTKGVLDEGVVYHILNNEDEISLDLLNVLDRQKNVKIINNKFLIKNDE